MLFPAGIFLSGAENGEAEALQFVGLRWEHAGDFARLPLFTRRIVSANF